MGTRIPVYTDTLGVPQITIYEEAGDGTFRKTSEEALRPLREYITGISPAIGVLVSNRFDRGERPWSSPTVMPNSGRPCSYYAFLRDCVKHHRLVVMTTPTLSGRIFKVSLHALLLKQGMSTQVVTLMANKYLEVLDVERQATPRPEAATEARPVERPRAEPRTEPPSAERNVRELTPNLLRILKKR